MLNPQWDPTFTYLDLLRRRESLRFLGREKWTSTVSRLGQPASCQHQLVMGRDGALWWTYNILIHLLSSNWWWNIWNIRAIRDWNSFGVHMAIRNSFFAVAKTVHSIAWVSTLSRVTPFSTRLAEGLVCFLWLCLDVPLSCPERLHGPLHGMTWDDKWDVMPYPTGNWQPAGVKTP
jgi:hypothetical protein